ncbi:MAG: hypothetical protein KAQ79_22705, partial [Cyclobacteriaceae bacterium]|nr:hypothetical protein [Cyclobacteriaceae bacterium]MCK5277985.1 hypothetical protein [Cyclobacteriaceae bacterium]
MLLTDFILRNIDFFGLQRLQNYTNIAPLFLKLAQMKRYEDLVSQTFEFPTEEFKVINNELHFHDIPLMEIISEYGTPLKLSYLPKISQNIEKA